VPVIQVQTTEQFVWQVSEPGREKGFRIGRAADWLASWQRRFEVTLGQFRKRFEYLEPASTDSFFGCELFLPGVQQSP
jgi:hypothetical protein